MAEASDHRTLGGEAGRAVPPLPYPFSSRAHFLGRKTLRVLDVDAPASESSVAPIQPAGSRPPLYLVSPGGGVIHPYYPLAPLLHPDQPVFGLQHPGLTGASSSMERMEDLAAHYVSAIRRIQPKGPYRLGGWSFGGMVAFEMAQQFARMGQEVSPLVLVDTYAKPLDGNGGMDLLHRAVALARNVPVGLSLARDTWPYVRDGLYLMVEQARRRNHPVNGHPSFREYARWAWADLLRNHFLKEADIAPIVWNNSRILAVRQPTLRKALRVMTSNLRSLRRYGPSKYPGRIVLIRAERQLVVRRFHDDPDLGWAPIAQGGVEVRTMQGNHAALLSKPYINELAQHLNAVLDKAHKTSY